MNLINKMLIDINCQKIELQVLDMSNRIELVDWLSKEIKFGGRAIIYQSLKKTRNPYKNLENLFRKNIAKTDKLLMKDRRG